MQFTGYRLCHALRLGSLLAGTLAIPAALPGSSVVLGHETSTGMSPERPLWQLHRTNEGAAMERMDAFRNPSNHSSHETR